MTSDSESTMVTSLPYLLVVTHTTQLLKCTKQLKLIPQSTQMICEADSIYEMHLWCNAAIVFVDKVQMYQQVPFKNKKG